MKVDRNELSSSRARASLFAGFATLAAVALIPAAGCTVTTGTTPDDGGIDFSDTGTGTGTTEECNGCLFQQCGGQWAVCEQSAECMAIYRCAIGTCKGDATCVRGCFDAHPTGQNAYTALYTCDQQGSSCECQSSCNGPVITCPVTLPASDAGSGVDAAPPDASTGADGAVGADAGPPAVATCTDCTNSRCNDQKQACAPASDCDQYAQCVFVCADQACTDTCAEAHPSGKANSDALATCTTSQCQTECGL